MERRTEKSFFDGHKREDVVEYRETFLEEMKSLLPYFVEFRDDSTILHKEYPEGCVVGGPDRRPIIMITHDESSFSANDSRRKVWTLEEDVKFFDQREEAKVLTVPLMKVGTLPPPGTAFF